jgi:nucleotide-binding universal stress UspA family protein
LVAPFEGGFYIFRLQPFVEGERGAAHDMSRRILVGLDHSDEAAAGLRRAVGLAKAHRSQLTLVHVAVPPPAWVGVGLLAMPMIDDVVTTGCELVRRAVEELPDELCVRWHLISGPDASCGLSRVRCVRRALASAVERGDHDLLVLGTGTRPGRVAAGLQRMLGAERVVTAPYVPAAEPVVLGNAPAMVATPII